MPTTNGCRTHGRLDYSAARADTFQQLLLPWTFFGWLNVTPRVGGRFTYYSAETGPGGTNGETYRKIFNTGVGRVLQGLAALDRRDEFTAGHGRPAPHHRAVGELRLSCRTPSTPPPQLPQFDSALPSLLLLPIQFPDYNNIDSIDSENVIRFGLRNTLQTKRDGQLDNLLDWNVMLDWRLIRAIRQSRRTFSPQQTFNDLYSDLTFRPRSWLTLESQTALRHQQRPLEPGVSPAHVHAERTVELGPRPLVFAQRLRWTAATISSPARCFSG